MRVSSTTKTTRCAIYTRVSTDHGLEQEFNSLDAQREASEAYIKSQAHEGWLCLMEQYNDGGYSGGSLERPALQKLLADVQAKKLDVIVVYKVDRLTRTLSDFAKLVELFDAHGVSFVSVTQSFNTTSSMGRLTLNVLLSFAQFEREVTGERIRDKIAASKKKGLWMGGVVPYGYRVEQRKLLIDEDEAKQVRLIFELYLELKSIPALIRELDLRNIRSRVRMRSSGESIGGIAFTTGPLHHILCNRVYLGEIRHRDQSYGGEHQPIIEYEVFNAVQTTLKLNSKAKSNRYERSGALLGGLLFDDRGNRMTPVHARKGNVRYRYYQSWVLAQGQKANAGSVHRVPALEIERVVTKAVLQWPGIAAADTISETSLVRECVSKIVVRPAMIQLTFKATKCNGSADIEFTSETQELNVPWSKPVRLRKREILGGPKDQPSRPIRAEARTRLLKAIAHAHRWLDRMQSGSIASIEAIATQNALSEKTVRSTLSLAFLAPDIVEAAIAGKLPRGLGLSQMTDLSLNWAKQRSMLGLQSSAPSERAN